MAQAAVVTSNEWIENAADFTKQYCNPKMQIALCIHAMALELATNNGTDYTGDFESLIETSDKLNHWMNPDQIAAAEVSIRYITAAGVGASVPATTAEKLEAAKKLLCYDDERLMRAKLYLIGALGQHATF